MSNAAEKLVRVGSDVYDFVVEFAIEHDLKISEAATVLLRFCMDKDFEVIRQQFTVREKTRGN